ncbi:MAG: cell division protein FtsW [Gemmatimonadetes bacterium]|nr:cell division protein FtsW [Gemmatimonadota bacterium]
MLELRRVHRLRGAGPPLRRFGTEPPLSARVDVAPTARFTLPDTGLGQGWEAAALTVTTLLLVSFGLVTLYSASGFLAQRQSLPDWYYVVRQAAGAGAGLMILWAASRTPYRFWQLCAWPLLMVVIIALVVVILPGTRAISPEINGARRWITAGPLTFQPSEIAKIAVVVWTAALAVKKQGEFASLTRGLAPFLIGWGLLLVPILLEPNLSTTCVVAALGGLVVFAAGGRIAHFGFLGLLALPLLRAQLGVGFRAQRMMSFFDQAADPTGAGFQVRQSLIAIGSGGLTGVGFGEGRQKFGFLPEAHNDFIFAMVGEEWGLLGVVFLVVLYTILVLLGLRVSRRAPDEFGQLLAIGLTGVIGVQALLHMAVGLALVPPTGLALPLVSYGRSNQIVTLAALGMLIAVARATDPDGRRGGMHRG